MKKVQITLLALLCVAAALTVGCGDSHSGFTKLPFVSDRTVDPATPLFLMNLDGSKVTPVQYDLDGIWSPSITADFKKVAFVSNGEVFVANSDGSGQTQLTTNSDVDAWTDVARISPNGKQIVFEVRDTLYHVFTMNVDGSNKVDLSATPPDGMNGGCYIGAFSADSSTVVFACWDGEGGSYGLYTSKTDGTSRNTVLTQGPFMDAPMFSPDGKKILFINWAFSPAISRPTLRRGHGAAVHRHGTPGNLSNQGVVSVNLDGSGLTTLVPNTIDAEILNSNLYYSYYNNDNSKWQIYKANLDGSGATSISDGTANDWLHVSIDGED